MARPMSDEGFHEIQLSGKQLVFLFMATTVVSVVIFLCGVLVGRGAGMQSAPRFAAAGDVSPASERPGGSRIDTTSLGGAPGSALAGMGAVEAAEIETADAEEIEETAGQDGKAELTYHDRLEADEDPPVETLETSPPAAERVVESRPSSVADRPAARPPAAAASPTGTRAAPPPAPARSSAASPRATGPAAASGSSPAPSDGYAVQVAALRNRTQAEAIVARLSGRGYPAYVLGPDPGAPARIYRVRVGSYPDRREAQQIVRRLETEEKLKPWITR